MNLTNRSRRAESGNTLIITVITLAVVGVFVNLAMQYTNAVNRNVQRSILLRQATNIADSSTEMAFSAWRAICRQNQSKFYKRSDFDNEIPTPTPGNFPGVANYNLSNYAIYPLDSGWNKLIPGASVPYPIAGPNHGDLSYYYVASADVVVPTVSSKTASSLGTAAALTDTGNIVAKVRRVFQKETLSLWRYAVFFNDDMEIHPGATMTINGDVHTNGSLYTGHNLLTLAGKTTYVNDWDIGFMAAENSHAGETPTSPNWSAGLPPAADQSMQPYGVALDDYHSLIDYKSTTDALDPYRFQDQAGYVITIDASNNVKIYNKTGKDVTNGAGGNDQKAANALKAAVSTNQTITDNREGATTGNGTVRVATLDVSVIQQAMDSSSGGTSFTVNNTVSGATVNNVLYIVDTSAGSTGTTNKRAIRIKNGSKLPDGGLTIVSGNPVYVQGDYNTGSALQLLPGVPPLIQPPSNSVVGADPTQPTVAGYTRQPAAIIADAVTLLSNSWVDSKSATKQAASNTTYNAAIISGNVPSANGNYSGGVENFPRFLESWSGKTVTYYGSMIELYKSQQAIGRWGSANVYDAPNRAWYFDTNFITTPPPGVLASYNYRRSRWYME